MTTTHAHRKRTVGSGVEHQRRIGRNVKTLLRWREMTILGLADHLGLSNQSLHGRLSGTVGMTIDELYAIADYLDVTLDVLLRDNVDLVASASSRCTDSLAQTSFSFDDAEQDSLRESDLVAA